MKIKFKLSLIILLVAVTLITLLYFVYIFNVKKAFVRQIENQLESVAEAKYIDINQFIQRRTYLIRFICSLDMFKTAFERNKFDKDFLRSIDLLDDKFPTVHEISIIDTTGHLLASTRHDSMPSIERLQREAFMLAQKNQIYLGEFSYDEQDKLSFYISSPLYNKDSTMVGVVLANMDGNDLMEIMDDSTGLGKTGETILGERRDSGVIYLVPLRHDRSTTMMYSNDIEGTALNVALLGKSGIAHEVYNYKGKKVYAATRFIQDQEWGLVTQINKEEALKPVKELSDILILLNLFLVIFLTIPAYIIGRYIAKPIEKLTETARRINEGELSERAVIKSGDEIGMLGKAFNEMTGKLEHKIHELDRYAYVISHDLKAPLSSIMPLADFLKEDYKNKPLDADGKEMLDMIKEKSLDMKKLIDGVLKSAREEYKMKEPVKVYDLVHNIVQNLHPPENIEVQITKNLPNTVQYHQVSLIQVFLNLISNAIKYMDKAEGHIVVDCTRQGEYYRFSVSDNGRGIGHEYQNKLFEEFTVAHDDPGISSSGLGLSIVKRIVEENGGNIGVESELGKGSVFYFTVKA
ncbi:MAG: sensor histidine kinase [Sporocytophaga sp.]|uniref:sensor histidine kinase n=1 Tax=Sporocytophaga sp. TaxID=2231183 RepID=UPI001B189987|nr:sensor histidine kinase [Sporocytophaga sp.]MBO9702203.1 sensor histidine kinase [Sporocytophaga sp.]